MDGAFALYEAYVRLQHGDIDSALVYGFGKPSLGDMADVFSQQLDPYTMGPLWADPDSLAALQARAMLDAGLASEGDFARVAARSLNDAVQNPFAHHGRHTTAQTLLDTPHHRAPLRASDVAPSSDGAACVILMTRDRASELSRKLGRKMAMISGIDHRIEPMQLGLRDLTRSESTRLAAERAGVAGKPVEIAELCARYAHEELVLKEALGLSEQVSINPSGGCFGANAPMVAGLVRIGEVASRIFRGEAQRGIAHATSGPCLQQNLVCVLEGA
jgi:acetyl-CoA acetyltransferase